MKPDKTKLRLDCHVDANFAGNWRVLDGDNANSVRSLAGYIVTFGNAPVLWKSKRIQEISLSTMESEYISLSMAMRSLVYLQGLLFEFDNTFSLGLGDSTSTLSTVFEVN